jgi:hypothetical protein
LASHTWFGSWLDRSVEVTSAAQLRNDIVRLQLLNTYGRARADKHEDNGRLIPATAYDNHLTQTSLSPYIDVHVKWTPWLRTVSGLRADVMHARVISDGSGNSGAATAALFSPKGGVVFGPWRHTELYANAGLGFHSNHANGAVQATDRADLLVRTHGAEIGLRTLLAGDVQSSLSVWLIDSDSELVYAPEIGFTQPERPGRRYGIEWNNFYRLRRWLAFDADMAWSTARYRIDPFDEGTYIPDAINGVVSAGVAISDAGRLSGSLRGRYLGRRPLVSDGSVFSRPSLIVNGQVDLRVTPRLDIGIEAFNILDRRYEDIAYYFSTRLRDPAGALEHAEQADFVTHPGEPRTVRIRLRARF